jgi:DNA-binding transcriptional regulator/RsmH inhibitor MraZ
VAQGGVDPAGTPAVFRGVTQLALDAKGRLAIPGKHRVRIELEDNAQKLVAPQFLDFTKSGLTINLPSDQPIEIKIFR